MEVRTAKPALTNGAQSALLMAAIALASLSCTPAVAGPLRSMMGGGSDNTVTAPGVITQNYDGRVVLIFAPPQLPPKGSRALVVVLHGGLGSAERIEGSGNETALSMDAVAQKNGFVVAYLDGTPASPRFSDRYTWNAGGGCCGQSYANDVDDVGYITGAVNSLVGQYGIDPKRIFGMGHSNGAMMTQRLMCETNLYSAAVVVSGPLMTRTSGSCPSARGKHILAIHGADDSNVPIGGGHGDGPASNVAFNSEASTQQVYANSGADYKLQIVPGADHKVANLDSALMQSEGHSISQKAALFFGLAGTGD